MRRTEGDSVKTDDHSSHKQPSLRMAGNLLDDPDLGQRAMLRRQRCFFALLRTGWCRHCRIDDQAAAVQRCGVFLEFQSRRILNRIGSKIDTTYIITRFVMLTWYGRDGIVVLGAVLVMMDMTRMRFTRRIDAIRLAIAMGVMPATAKDTVNQHRQHCR